MSVKLLMRWDIKPEQDQEYFEFILREWIPQLEKLDVEPIAAWYTLYSRNQTQQIMTEVIADNLQTMNQVIHGMEWQTLHEKLLKYIENYEQKIVRVTGGFQL